MDTAQLLRIAFRGSPLWCRELGKQDGATITDEELAATRRNEFTRACKLLKVSDGTVLDYPDARLDRQNFYTTVADLALRVRQLKPDVIMSMGQEGAITAHPDHSMVSIFATMAFHWAGRNNRFPEQLQNGVTPHQTRKLYYGTALFTMPDREPVSPSPHASRNSLFTTDTDRSGVPRRLSYRL